MFGHLCFTISVSVTLFLQLEQMLAVQSGDSDQESVYGGEQQRVQAECRAYRLRLQAYQDSQHRQSQLVHKLQAKVLQHFCLYCFVATITCGQENTETWKQSPFPVVVCIIDSISRCASCKTGSSV